MLRLYKWLESELMTINNMSKVVSLDNEKELKGNEHIYAAMIEPVDDRKYKKKGRNETPILLHLYCTNVKELDSKKICLALRDKAISILDEKSIKNTYIRVYDCERGNKSPAILYDEEKLMYYCSVSFIVKWRAL